MAKQNALVLIRAGLTAGALLLLLFFSIRKAENSPPRAPPLIQPAAEQNLSFQPNTDARPVDTTVNKLSAEQPFRNELIRLNSHEPSPSKRALMLEELANWTRLNPTDAAAWADSLEQDSAGKNDLRIRAIELVAKIWAASDPLAALEWAGGLSDPNDGWQAERSVYVGWAETDPVEFSEWLSVNSTNRTIDVSLALKQLGDVWFQNDPGAAAKWMTENPLDESGLFLRAAVFNWSVNDPFDALEFILTNHPDNDLLKAVVIEQMAKVDPVTALRLAEQLTSPLQQERIRSALREMLKQNPNAAYEYFSRLSDDSDLKMALAPDVAGGMGGYDAWRTEGIVAWMDIVLELTQIDGDFSRRYNEQFTRTLQSWAAQNPQSAVNWINGLEMGNTGKMKWAGVVAAEWAQTDAAAAVEYLNQLPEPPDRSTWESVAYYMASQNPAEAAKLVETKSLTESRLINALTTEWAKQNPPHCADWIMQQELPENTRSNALTALTAEWFRISPDAAAEWADSIGVSGDKQIVESRLTELRARFN